MSATINIGRTIARERRRKGVTQEELASHLGVSKAAVSKWELEQSLPDVSLLPRIAAYFSLTLDELFDWRDELTEAESAALYAEVYALAEQDPAAAHERLRALATAHYSDANLLLMLASLLTVWAAGMATPFAPAREGDGSYGEMPDADTLVDEALALLDRAHEVATDPATLYLAQQQKATVLFQAGRHEEVATLLEPLVRRPDAGAATMLLISSYRKLGRDDDALELLQAERLRATNYVLSSLVQEVSMRDDPAFARKAAAAATAIFDALDMGTVNPWYPVTMGLEKADALRRAGKKEEALDALAFAAHAAGSVEPQAPDPAQSPFFDRMEKRTDPSRAGAAWAEHKARQTDKAAELMRQAVAEQAASPAWRAFAGSNPRYLDICASIQR